MLYKIFLVEDEIVAREGIRDNVDWKSAGFEFCGEAPDGEIALPLIETIQPDVLITDIKMPFMDGLQLCKIVRERMPWVKIIILSGHDEFNYAQTAVKLGVSEYLLKPISSLDLHNVLQKVASQLDQERKDKESLKRLRNQVEDNLLLLREKFLLRLVMGGEASPAAIEQSQQLGLDIIAKCYLVVLLKIELVESTQPFDYDEYQQVERLVASLVEQNPDAFLVKKDLEELVLIIKGDGLEQLEQEGYFLAELIKQSVEDKTGCRLAVGLGSPQQRLGDIHHSFAEALARVKGTAGEETPPLGLGSGADKAQLLKLDRSALENYLKFGIINDFDSFFDTYIQSLSEAALQSYLVKNYVFVDIVLMTAKFVSDMGGNMDQVIPEINNVETLLMNIKTLDQIKVETRKILTSALAFRDGQVRHQRAGLVHQAKAYIDNHFTDPDLSLNKVAAQVNLSASHFSTVFSHETGETFRDYLTRIRIDRAKELLRTTSLKSFEVAYQSGYNDPHYFSHIFRKNTGFSPQQYRLQPHSREK
jgi:two-component system response regulator YesN